MKKILIILILSFGFGTANAQNGMFMPSTVDNTYNMYTCDICQCYVVVIENIGFGNWAESEPINWYRALSWMTKGDHNFPGSYWILNICDPVRQNKQYEYYEYTEWIIKGDF
jgi:hypothetical protein